MTNADSEKEKFYSDLDKLMVSTLVPDKLIIMGDFNARVESNAVIWWHAIRQYGTAEENSGGTLLLSEFVKWQLVITNTFSH